MKGSWGGLGMREMLTPTSAIAGMGLDAYVALITDGFRAGGHPGSRHWSCLTGSHAAGAHCYIRSKEGDTIAIDIPNKSIQLKVDETEIKDRLGTMDKTGPEDHQRLHGPPCPSGISRTKAR
ncbi:MAG: dihydroxy-acid dehydratase [Desulfobacterales bacterium]